MRHLRLCCAVCLLVWALHFENVSATVILPADFTSVVAESGVIVHGRVTEVRSILTGPRRLIESIVTVAVLESFKGDVGNAVAFRVSQGEVGRYRRVLVGAPAFTEGEQVVVFLTGRPPAMPTVFGLNQGVYRVSRAGTAGAMVMPPPPGTTGRVVRGDPARVPVPISAFARELRAVLERSR